MCNKCDETIAAVFTALLVDSGLIVKPVSLNNVMRAKAATNASSGDAIRAKIAHDLGKAGYATSDQATAAQEQVSFGPRDKTDAEVLREKVNSLNNVIHALDLENADLRESNQRDRHELAHLTEHYQEQLHAKDALRAENNILQNNAQKYDIKIQQLEHENAKLRQVIGDTQYRCDDLEKELAAANERHRIAREFAIQMVKAN